MSQISDSTISAFKISATDAELDDLQARLKNTRWPERETPNDWSQGIPLNYLKELCAYWASDYNWREREAKLNRFDQFTTLLDTNSKDSESLSIHFIHQRSKNENARPLIMTHGWPGSVVEFQKVIEPLTNPEAHGGSAEDAFHVVCPSLPGYGFSDKPTKPGCGVAEIAGMWNDLMVRLGYTEYVAQGGDWGSAVTTAIGLQNLGNCKAIHVNMPNAGATKAAREAPDAADKRALERAMFYQQWDSGYSKQQSTRPQTLGYGLVDSPSGQAGWIVEKFYAWTDCAPADDPEGPNHPENAISREELLDNVMLYWLPATGASSARLYWESFGNAFGGDNKATVTLPTGCSLFPCEIVPTPRSWAEQRYTNIKYWNELNKGGHFAAFEQPELFVGELRNCFSQIA